MDALLILTATALFAVAAWQDHHQHRVSRWLPAGFLALALLHPGQLIQPPMWGAVLPQVLLFLFLYLIGYIAPADVRVLSAIAVCLHGPPFWPLTAAALLALVILQKEVRGLWRNSRGATPLKAEPFMPYLLSAWLALLSSRTAFLLIEFLARSND